MPWYFRFTPHGLAHQLPFFLEKFSTFVCAREYKGQPNEHFHIYIDTDMSDDTIKNYAYEYLKIQKGQRGKANKYFCLKKWNDDISYVVKGGDIIAAQGFDPLVIAQKTVEGRERFVNVILSKFDRNSQDTNKEFVGTTKAKP